MNANELRIGNVVAAKRIITFLKADDEVDFCAAPGMPLTICATNIEFITVKASFKNKVFKQAVLIDSIAPIHLTDEIVLKCGFGEVRLYENVYHLDNFRIYLDKSNNIGLLKYEKESNNFEIEITSIHQLQNIYFSLTGTELTVKI